MESPNAPWQLDVTLLELIESSVSENPETAAVRFRDQVMTYTDLDKASDKYAHYLKSIGVANGDIVAVLQDRSLELVVSLLGILKAGAAYLPLDPTHPSTRLQFVLEDADVSVVLTQTSYEHCIPDFLGTVRCVDTPEVWLPESADTEQLSAVASETRPEDLAYVIYTSGSTGQPKGCMLPHQAICNRLQWMQSEYSIGHGDHVLQKTPYTFDVSVWEFFWPLITGSTIVMADPGAHKDNNYLIRTIQDQAVNVCHFVPSMLRFFLNAADVSKCTTLKKVFVSGEALPHELVVLFQEKLPNCELHNLYGPTEAAVDVSYWACHPREDGIVPIGKAIANIELYILDESLKQVAEGEEGELFIAGIGLARGYLNRPELTAERFIPNPFSDDANARSSAKMYRTGDLARQLPDGNIEYIGRTDFQVKLRGLRIELGEIETCLRQYAGVTEAAVLVRDEAEDPKLVAYLESTQVPESKAVRNHCKAHLPEYMVPNVVVTLPQLPVTTHGKLDRKALPWPVDASAQAQKQAPVKPTKESHVSLTSAPSQSNAISKTELTEKVQSYVCEVLRQETVDAEDDLFDLGATSLSLVRVVEKIQQGLGCVVPVDVFLDQPTVSGIVGYLIEQGVGTEDEAKPQEVETSVSQEQASASQCYDQVSSIVTTILRRDTIALEDDFFDLGATSLSLVRVAEKIQKDMNVAVPVDVFLDNPTVQGVCEYIASQVTPSSTNSEETTSSAASPVCASKDVITLEPIHFQSEFYQHSNTAEAFAYGVIPLAQFSSWIGLLQKQDREGRGRYLYPSGGGYNPVRTYLSINNNAIEGIAGGSYYYDPQGHQLYRVGDVQVPTSQCHEYDQDAVSQAGFAVYFIVSLDAIAPIYGDVSRSLAALESGYMLQLLQSRQSECGLGVRSLVSCDFDAIRDGFDLNPSERFVLGLVGGLTKESATNKQPLFDFLHAHEALGLPQQLGSVQLNHHGEDTYAQAQNLSKPLLEAFHDAHHQFRRFDSNTQAIALPTQSFAWDDYRLRACQRDYQSDVVELGQLTRLLALSQESANQQRLYVDSVAHANLCLYVYIKPGRVEGVSGGIYRYDAKAHTLSHRGDVDESRMTMAYTPFNRQHFKRAAFCVYIVQEAPTLPGVSRERTQHLSFIAAGTLGQVMMERQAEFALGLCPIGAIRFDKVSEAFGVSKDASVVQSFTGGVYSQEIPVDRQCLESDPLREVGRLRASLGKPTNNTHSDQMDIAIVGMSGVYPGAENLDEFWQNLREGKVAIGDFPKSRLSELESSGLYVKGGFLDNISNFDSLLFDISPAEAKMMDPQERLLLQQVWACLEDAGYSPENLNKYCDTTGVYVGAMWNDYQSRGIESWTENGEVREASYHGSLANRISYFFNFEGPSIAINTSCSSAMTALHTACKDLKLGEVDAALVGGVNLISHRYHADLLTQQEYLTDREVCKPLSSDADGWSIGEGVGVFLLKPLNTAIENRDHIYGVIKSTEVSHSGRAVRYAAPNATSQSKGLRRLLNRFNGDVDCVELAAPGASMADAAEMSAVQHAFEHIGSQSVTRLSTVKGNIGHLESASAMSQLTKVLLQFKHKAWAPSVGNTPSNPLLGIDQSKHFCVNDCYEKWGANRGARVLVNAIGASGSAAHVLIDTYQEQEIDRLEKGEIVDKGLVIPISAETEQQLALVAKSLLGHLEGHDERISDVAFTLNQGRESLRVRAVFVAKSTSELIEQLKRFTAQDGCVSTLENTHLLDSNVKAWLEGTEDELPQMPNSLGKRISLPTYPFKEVSHWISGNEIPYIHEEDKGQYVEKDLNRSQYNQIERVLKSVMSQVTEISIDELDEKTEFERLGLSSLMIEKATVLLKEKYAGLPESVIFQNRNLKELAEYIACHQEKYSQKSRPKNPSKTKAHRKNFSAGDQDIAIVGLSCKFPGANNAEEFWRNLESGVDSITEVPEDRWNHDLYYSSTKNTQGKTYSKWGGFIDEMDRFDPLFFNITPREAELIDPQERQFLMRTYEAFEDAGYSRNRIQEKTDGKVGVFAGAMYNEYQLYQHNNNGTGQSSCLSTIANRVSYFYDFTSPSMALDTMCSSSLTAIHLACESIKNGESRWAVAGGVNLNLHPNKYVTHASMTMSSSHGRCKAFSKDGDGFVASEGVGVVILKPLSEAIGDGDHIYGVVKSTALNHGGRTNGFTVPDPRAHTALIKDAWNQDCLNPDNLSYIEAHGTGTKLGDPIEIEGVYDALTDLGKNTKCAIGSVKSNIGHCESAAGIAGLIKVLMQMKHKMLAPSLYSDELNPSIDFDKARLRVQSKLEAWVPEDDNGESILKLASISSFGAGGSNAHVIIEESPVSRSTISREQDTVAVPIFAISAKDSERLVALSERYIHLLENNDIPLSAVAYTSHVGRDVFEQRLSFVFTSKDDLISKLEKFIAGGMAKSAGSVSNGLLAILNDKDVASLVYSRIKDNEDWQKLSDAWSCGVDVNWQYFWEGCDSQVTASLPAYPFKNDRYWKGSLSQGPAIDERHKPHAAPGIKDVTSLLQKLENKTISVKDACERTLKNA